MASSSSSLSTSSPLEPLDLLCQFPDRITQGTLYADMIKAVEEDMGNDIPLQFRESMLEAMKGCYDLQLFYVFTLAASVPRCAAVLFNYNNRHPRTVTYLKQLNKAWGEVMRTVWCPGDVKDVHASGGDGDIATPVDFAGHMRLQYFKIY